MAQERITVDPNRMRGLPSIRDTRVTVSAVLGLLAADPASMSCWPTTPTWNARMSSPRSNTQPAAAQSASWQL
jgi:hypothetical protein